MIKQNTNLRTALLGLAMLIASSLSFGQARETGKQIPKKIESLRNSSANFETVNLFSAAPRISRLEALKEVRDYTAISVDPSLSRYIIERRPSYVRIFVPGINSSVLLYRFSSFDELRILTSSGARANPAEMAEYRGTIENDPNSVASFTFTESEISGLVCNDQGNFNICKLTKDERYIVYNHKDLRTQRSFECGTDESYVVGSKPEPNAQFLVGTKCVKWYYETDYDIFVGKGSVANVTSYIQGMFSQVATLYANDGMSIQLKTLFVWDTVDPYNATTTSNLLTQFGQNRTTFDGDLAHLLGYVGNGGIAYVNTLCVSNNANKMAYSDINPTYSLVPAYSWTIECVAHEQGHNVASRHTHDCAWNGNNTAIDGCGPTAGYTTPCAVGPLPTNGGTIMSYCHLVSGVGINFNNGFGPQPASLMVNTISAKACLVACDSSGSGGGGCTSVPPQPGPISGPASPCVGTTNVYSVAPVAGATSYTWQMLSGWSGTSTTNTISITAGSGSGNIAVFASNACGNGSPSTLFVTGQSAPATPSSISGPTGVCKNQSGVVYSTPAVTGATNYTWTVPSGSVITSGSGTNTITVTFGTRKGKVTVKANNGCGSSAARTLNVNITCRDVAPLRFDFKAFPNPAYGSINVSVVSETSGTYRLRMLDMKGSIAYDKDLFLNTGPNATAIDISNLPSGVYQMEISNGETKKTIKISVSR